MKRKKGAPVCYRAPSLVSSGAEGGIVLTGLAHLVTTDVEGFVSSDPLEDFFETVPDSGQPYQEQDRARREICQLDISLNFCFNL